MLESANKIDLNMYSTHSMLSRFVSCPLVVFFFKP